MFWSGGGGVGGVEVERGVFLFLVGQPFHHHMRRPVNCLVEFRVKVI